MTILPFSTLYGAGIADASRDLSSSSSEDEFDGWGDDDDNDEDEDEEEEGDDDTDEDDDGNVYDWTVMDTGGEGGDRGERDGEERDGEGHGLISTCRWRRAGRKSTPKD